MRALLRGRSLVAALWLTVAAIGLATVVPSTMALLTASSSSSGSTFSIGTVKLDSTATTAALLSLTAAAPGNTTSGCVRITNSGSLSSTVKAYAAPTGGLGAHLTVTIERGSGLTGAYPSCAGFTSAATIYTGTLSALPTTYASGLDAQTFTGGQARDYRVSITLGSSLAGQGLSAAAVFTWEARQ